jgi:excisionase family DNA binding protein
MDPYEEYAAMMALEEASSCDSRSLPLPVAPTVPLRGTSSKKKSDPIRGGNRNNGKIVRGIESAASPFMTADEAADYMGGRHVRTINRWAREGYLPGHSVGRGKRKIWLFDRKRLYDWVLAQDDGVKCTQPPVLRSERKNHDRKATKPLSTRQSHSREEQDN